MRARIAADDSGAALVLVLIIVTVLSVGLVAVLALSDTSIRTTVALRAQAGDTYAADAAAQIAIDQIRRDAFPGTCDPTQPDWAWCGSRLATTRMMFDRSGVVLP